MKQASAALETLLETGSFIQTDLYTIALTTGAVLRYTTADVDITDGTNTWTSGGPYIDEVGDSAARGHWKIGLDVDTWNIKIMPRSSDDGAGIDFPDQINGLPWLQAARGGVLTGALFRVDRAYASAWPQPWTTPFVIPSQYVLSKIFYGLVADVDLGLSYAIVTANDFRQRLTIQMPRNFFSAPCRHTLFDTGCRLSPVGFFDNSSVLAGSTRNAIITALPKGAAYYALGRVVMTSGLNQSFQRGIRNWDGATLTLVSPFPFTLSPGDTFSAYAGCDKSRSQCGPAKFNNSVNYGGEPYIPAPET